LSKRVDLRLEATVQQLLNDGCPAENTPGQSKFNDSSMDHAVTMPNRALQHHASKYPTESSQLVDEPKACSLCEKVFKHHLTFNRHMFASHGFRGKRYDAIIFIPSL
jgi:hypothetical protein